VIDRLDVVRIADRETAGVTEFRYLDAMVLDEARRVFAAVEVVEPARAGRDGAGAVLLLGPQPVFVGRASLARMRQQLAAGAVEVRPWRLADRRGVDLGSIRTLRAYERLEARLLADPPDEPPPGRSPIALLTPARARQVLAGPIGEETGGEDAGLAAAGLCHVFADYYGQPRGDLLPLVPAGVRTVLDLGCGRGATGELLQRRFGCAVTGVELNPVVARAAAAVLDRVEVGDLERLEIPGRYDLVLALDVVEHLADPWRLLERLPGWLAPGGRALLSIPNVGHFAIVEDLLAGRFDYLPIGLLCVTHLRFFTRDGLERALRQAGLTRFAIHLRGEPLPARFTALARQFELDRDNLAAEGFYVVVEG